MSDRFSFSDKNKTLNDHKSEPESARSSLASSGFSPLLSPLFIEKNKSIAALEKAFVEFLSRWRDSIGLLLKDIEVDAVLQGIDIVPFSSYLDTAADLAEIHIFKIEEIDAQCAWIFDRRLISCAVDCLFGGLGDVLPGETDRRYTAVDLSVRHRLISFLVLAFEASFPQKDTVRLKLVRQERRISHLKIADAENLIVRARFTIRLNRGDCPIEFCAPLSAIQFLLDQGDVDCDLSKKSSNDLVDVGSVTDSVPVEVVAVLSDTSISVAQLAALSLGQIIPFSVGEEPVRLFVNGDCVMHGRSGTKSGNYAVKIDSIVLGE